MWYVYIIRCLKDNSLYTGITNNLNKRIAIHNDGKGAKYTRGRRPVILMKYFQVDNKSHALRIEMKIKSLPKNKKLMFSLSQYDYKKEN